MSAGPQRRDVLRVAGAAAVAVPVLTACGRGSEPTGSSTTAADGAVRLDVTGLEEGQSRVYPSARVVVSLPSGQDYVVFDSRCPHQGCAVSEREDDKLVCPCHASYFDPATGEVLSGPAATGLTVVPSSVEGSEIVIRG